MLRLAFCQNHYNCTTPCRLVKIWVIFCITSSTHHIAKGLLRTGHCGPCLFIGSPGVEANSMAHIHFNLYLFSVYWVSLSFYTKHTSRKVCKWLMPSISYLKLSMYSLLFEDIEAISE